MSRTINISGVCMSVDKKRLFFLDSVRGIAALMVASAHFIERTPLHKVWMFKYLNLGQMGVVAFFIISGMVIPFSFKPGRSPLISFFISRVFRLYPAYWLSVFLAFVIFTFLYHIQIPIITVIKNLTMFQSILQTPDLFGVYWTLIIEIFFYVCCACLFSLNLLSERKVLFILSACMLILAFTLSIARFLFERKLPVAIPLCMSLMFFGGAWRNVSLGIADYATKRFSVIFIYSFLILIIPISLMAYNRDYGHGENAFSYIVSYAAGIALTIILTTKLKINSKIFVYLGAISYSVYLMHPFFLEIFYAKSNMSRAFDFLIFFVYILSIISLASLTYLFIERPSVNLGRRINNALCKNKEL